MADYDDYGDDDYYDEEFDERAYAKEVLSKLDSSIKVSEAAIVRKLEETEYNIPKTVKFFKNQAAAAAAAKKSGGPSGVASGGGGGAKKAPVRVGVAPISVKQTSALGATSVASVPATTSTSSSSAAATTTAGPTTTTSTSGGRAQKIWSVSAQLSDDELEEPASAAKTMSNLSIATAASAAAAGLVNITMVVVGHVDSGKSTLSGNLLYKTGNVSARTMHKYEKESQAVGKGSFSYAWVMDESASERSRGVTVSIAERHFSTSRCKFTLLDAPGHKDFVPSMISGAVQADVAVLVVPATAGEFETCMLDNAQTKEHLVLLNAMGVNHIVVAVNKMDNTQPMPWSQDRFEQIKGEVQLLLRNLLFEDNCVRFVPVSGLSGLNLVTPLTSSSSSSTTTTTTSVVGAPPPAAAAAASAETAAWSWYSESDGQDVGSGRGATTMLSLVGALEDLSCGPVFCATPTAGGRNSCASSSSTNTSIAAQRSSLSFRKPFRAMVLGIQSTATNKSGCEVSVAVIQGSIRTGRSIAWHTGNSVKSAVATTSTAAAATATGSGCSLTDNTTSSVWNVHSAIVTRIVRPGAGSSSSSSSGGGGRGGGGDGGDELISCAEVGDRVTITLQYKQPPGSTGGAGSSSAINNNTLAEESLATGATKCCGVILFKPPSVMRKAVKLYASITTAIDLDRPIIPGAVFELFAHGEVHLCAVTLIHSMQRPESTTSTTTSSSNGNIASSFAAPPSVFRVTQQPVKSKIKVKCIPSNCQAVVKIELLGVNNSSSSSGAGADNSASNSSRGNDSSATAASSSSSSSSTSTSASSSSSSSSADGVVMEPFGAHNSILGRFVLRARGRTCAIGVCEELIL